MRTYLSVLARDPRDFAALNDLGTVLFEAGYRRAARTAYETAVQHHPARAMGHVNLANLLAETGETVAARAHYRHALAVAPDDADAHRGLAALLADDGEHAAATDHRRIAYARQPIMPQPFRGSGLGTPLLLLIGAAGGNVPTRPLIDTRRYRVTALAPEFAPGHAPLPPHALVFNAIGDPDLAQPALDAAQMVLLRSRGPVINAPAAVLRTGRVDIARRLAGLGDVRVPTIASLDR
ncbi:MAG: tetratricopeptide repeat protein, partial [Alphaproteobacteria bacterium]|nr:tetratricopeptide repeat protein [Alphaproteobacteria bacterium]